MTYSRINAYRIMWLIVLFDLPVTTATQKRRASGFRKDLLADGFTMMQYSVYARHCASKESADVHTKRIENLIPPEGHVSIMRITDKQYSLITNFWGRRTAPTEPAPPQMELF
ncbi:MAG: CRISPR-associated endonuclease Cas2 [Balneolia bacterium]|nr:CRISPR-associated endonuclease Cas2 [Balneolia bacterium]